MQTIKFEKYQGLGNDFILLEMSSLGLPVEVFARDAEKLCDRRFGIGADGLLFFEVLQAQERVRMVYYNSDGSRAETCFNGLRCAALHAILKQGFVKDQPFAIQTDAGDVKSVFRTDDKRIQVELNGPSFDPVDIGLNQNQPAIEREFTFSFGALTGTAVSVGNPHFVTWVADADLNDLNEMIMFYGQEVEKSSLFLNGTNFEAASFKSLDRIQMAVWERGAGKTLACGSGATAAVCAGVKTGRLKPDKFVKVQMLGGELDIKVEDNFRKLSVIGEAKHVFSGLTELKNSYCHG